MVECSGEERRRCFFERRSEEVENREMLWILPDELWRRILEIGVESGGWNCRELCCLSMLCRRLRRLSSEEPLWNRLLSSHYPRPLPSSSSSSKSIYQLKFERDKQRRRMAHRMALRRKTCEVFHHYRNLAQIKERLAQETATATQTTQELLDLRRLRQASVALNVWQPEVVRGQQKQMVEQCVVPAECRIHTLEMELRLCKQQIVGLEKHYRDEKCRLNTAKEELASMEYHPVRELKRENEHNVKRKKLKKCNNIKEKENKAA